MTGQVALRQFAARSLQMRRSIMIKRRCETCGNGYDKPFQIIIEGKKTYTFDSFECAIHALAPICGNCGVRILGHGVEQGEKMYCCAHCAAAQGADRVRDRA